MSIYENNFRIWKYLSEQIHLKALDTVVEKQLQCHVLRLNQYAEEEIFGITQSDRWEVFWADITGSRIIICGNGEIGRSYYEQIKKCKWVDQIRLCKWIPQEDETPIREHIASEDYDCVILAYYESELADDSKEKIAKFFPKERIIWWKPIRSSEPVFSRNW